MYKIWAQKIKDNKIIDSITIFGEKDIAKSDERDKCLNEVCEKFDISVPIWLDKHQNEFYNFFAVTFFQEDFIDEINFDKLKIERIDN